MEKEMFVLKLIFTKGLGIVNQWKIMRIAETLGIYDFTPGEIGEIVGPSKFLGVIKTSWRELQPEKIRQLVGTQEVIFYHDLRYPRQLLELPQPPLALFYVGNFELLTHPMIGFVGARDATAYGKQIVENFIPQLVAENYAIVSGLAKGIDSYSHHSAIQAEGYTIAVVGCGVDICYPKEVFPIYSEMKENHLIVSEYPAGTTPKKHHFPMRNRIIAGLCQGLVVVEAKERSGSLITAQQALENGREVFAIPGEIISGRSNGCHRLIQDGAKCVITPQDILEELPLFTGF